MSANPFTLQAFADWIKGNRKPETRYDFHNAMTCACAQYADHLGTENWLRGVKHCEGFWYDANRFAGAGPSNFGSLHDRLTHAVKELGYV